jgi:hypothetical protein
MSNRLYDILDVSHSFRDAVKLACYSLCHWVLALLLIVLMSACNQAPPENTSTSVTPESLNKSKGSEIPDTSLWVRQVNILTGASYVNEAWACLDPTRAKNVIHFDQGNHPNSPFNDRLIIYQDAHHEVVDQLKALHEAGMLTMTTDMLEGKTVVIYQLSLQGWMAAGKQYGMKKRLCFPAGHDEATQINKHEALPDQESGLAVYRVEYDRQLIYEDWVTNGIRHAFKLEKHHPKTKKFSLLVVLGPNGVYMTPLYNQLRRTYPVERPSREILTTVLRNDREFLNDVCSRRHVEKTSNQSCSAPTLQKRLVADYGGQERNQRILIRFHNQASGDDLIMGELTMFYNTTTGQWQRYRGLTILH